MVNMNNRASSGTTPPPEDWDSPSRLGLRRFIEVKISFMVRNIVGDRKERIRTASKLKKADERRLIAIIGRAELRHRDCGGE